MVVDSSKVSERLGVRTAVPVRTREYVRVEESSVMLGDGLVVTDRV